MHRRLIRIGWASVEYVGARWGFVAVMLNVLIFIVPAFVKAEDRNGAQPAVAETGDAVNVMWRFDGGGRFPNIHPPSEWRMDRNILWKTPVEIGGDSSPIVVGDKVFLTAEMGSLICLDIAEGNILWKKDLFSQDSEDIPPDLSRKLMRGCPSRSFAMTSRTMLPVLKTATPPSLPNRDLPHRESDWRNLAS